MVEAGFDHLVRERWRAPVIPELVKVFTSVKSAHVKEVVISAQEGGASLGILSGLVAGNFSALLAGAQHGCADGAGLLLQHRTAMAEQMLAPAVFAFGLVAFGFLGMGPGGLIAVDSYGPVYRQRAIGLRTVR